MMLRNYDFQMKIYVYLKNIDIFFIIHDRLSDRLERLERLKRYA
jgi:hypothetical protein